MRKTAPCGLTAAEHFSEGLKGQPFRALEEFGIERLQLGLKVPMVLQTRRHRCQGAVLKSASKYADTFLVLKPFCEGP